MKKTLFWLILIVLFGGFLRFWQLSSRPASLSIDEVAIAYNSYSILKTGHDEWGEFLPLAFRSIGDYKPPVLVYLMVPAMEIFGLTEFGTRFTVALVGTLSLILIYLLAECLTKNKTIALGAAFSVAISPWHLQYSRMTHEAIVALLFLISGTWIFLDSLEKEGRRLWLASVFFVLTLYTYHSERLFTPLFVAGLGVIFFKELTQKKVIKRVLLAAVLGLILIIPFAKIMLGPQGKTRAVNAFLGQDVEINYQLHKEGEKLSTWQKIFDSNFLIVFNFWSKRYLEYFNLPYFFFKGMKLSANNAPGVGLMHLFEMPLFLLGLWWLFVRKFFEKKYMIFLVFWFFLGPIAASVANNELHPARSLTMVPVPQIITALGLYVLWQRFKKFPKKVGFLFIGGGGLTVVLSLIYYLNLYHFHYPINFSEYCSYGMKEAALFVWNHQGEYEKIVIDSTLGTQGPFTVSTPHLYVYFYGKYEPRLLQEDPLHGKGPDKDSSDFLNFSFRPIYWPTDRFAKNTLFVGSPWSLPPNELSQANLLKDIRFLDGSPALLVVATKK